MLDQYELDNLDIQEFNKYLVNTLHFTHQKEVLKYLGLTDDKLEFLQKYIKMREKHYFNDGKLEGRKEFRKQLFEMIKPEED